MSRCSTGLLRAPAKAPGQQSPTFSSLYGEMGLELYGTTFEHVLGPSKPITGYVRVKGTGEPVVGVTVTGSVPGKMWSVIMTKTDERGHFRIDGLSKSPKYRVDARPAQGSPYLGWSPQTVSDTEGLKPIDTDLELSRGVAVTGRLIDKTTGQPVPCDWIQYYPLPGNPDQGTPQGIPSGIDHSFRITVPHGGGMIAVKARGKSLPYPGARLNPADKGKFQIKGEDGSQFGIDLVDPSRLRICRLPRGNRVATLDMEVTPVSRSSSRTCRPERTARDRSVGHGPDHGPIRVDDHRGLQFRRLRIATRRNASCRNPARRPCRRWLGDHGGSDPADRSVVVKLVRYGALAGRVFDEDGLPLRGAKISAIVEKRQRYGPSDPNFRPREAVSDGDGRFRIEGINPSLSVRLWFHKPGAPPYSHQPQPDKDLSNVMATPGETLDVGDVTVRFNSVQ